MGGPHGSYAEWKKKSEDNSNCRKSLRNNAWNNKAADMKNKVTLRVGEAIEDIWVDTVVIWQVSM